MTVSLLIIIFLVIIKTILTTVLWFASIITNMIINMKTIGGFSFKTDTNPLIHSSDLSLWSVPVVCKGAYFRGSQMIIFSSAFSHPERKATSQKTMPDFSVSPRGEKNYHHWCITLFFFECGKEGKRNIKGDRKSVV